MAGNVCVLRGESGGLVVAVGGKVLDGLADIDINGADGVAVLTIPLSHVVFGELAPILKAAEERVEGRAAGHAEVIDFAKFRAAQAVAEEPPTEA
ncbi:hypothetical protein [Hansschlegelia beijingensis]|uniref:Uncharacterized protein n=1 Tax=Hansschlegelia beijingensis TaxID=1133344 RepID=A0A7W6GGH8_9HYPH|nr:hypothetical protein [Hansschlegelia beijingensis]MBB3972769.1 hypothetical protein [Hansschlegelia beijingensis]